MDKVDRLSDSEVVKKRIKLEDYEVKKMEISTISNNTHVAEFNDLDESIEELLKNYKPVLERYFTAMYCIGFNDKPIDHQVVLFHSNKICLLTIAPSHPVMKFKKTILKINCDVGNLNRLDNKVSGKGKKGGQKLLPNTVLCVIEACDGTKYNFYSTIKGKLLEMNDSLQENPNRLLGYTNTKGHIAVVLSDLSAVNFCKQNMLTECEYQNKIVKENT